MKKNAKYYARQRYYNKIYEEFGNNSESLKKIVGRYNVESFFTNDNAYNTLKERVKKERSYLREREQIKKDMNDYRKKVNLNQELTTRKKLSESLKKNEVNQLMDIAKQEGHKYKDLLNDDKRSNIIADKMLKDLLHEYDLDVNGTKKTRRGVFSQSADEPTLQKHFDELKELVKQDKNPLKNYQKSMDYFLSTIIPQRYAEWNKRGGEFVKPPLEFRETLLKDLVGYYKKIM